MAPSHDHELASRVATVEMLIAERDKLYDTRFKAAEVAVNAALAAQEKQTASSFLASEKAITKAEEAQLQYNVRSNEFRGQLDDQAKTLMPRTETMTMFKSIEERLAATNIDREKKFDMLSAEIVSLREKQSVGAAEKSTERRGRDDTRAWWLAGISTAGFILLLVTFLLKFTTQPAPVPPPPPAPYVPAPYGTTLPAPSPPRVPQ